MRNRHLWLLAWMVYLATPGSSQANWTWVGGGPDGGNVQTLLEDPANPDTLYASSVGGIFRSGDGGAHWTRASGEIGQYTLDGFGRPLIADPDQPGRLYFATRNNEIFRSDNGGSNWSWMTLILGGSEEIQALLDEPGTMGGIYVLTAAHGLLYGPDGVHYVQRNSGLPATVMLTAMAIAPANHSVMLLGTSDGTIFRSADAGTSWQLVAPLGNPSFYNVNSIVFAGSGRVYAAINSLLYRSNDLGLTWTSLYGAASVASLLADDSNVDKLLIGRADGLWLSMDGGATVAPLNNGLALNGTVAPRVTSIVRENALTPDPRLWVATDNAGIFVSTDFGQNWTPANLGLAGASFRAVAIHPSAPSRFYAGYSNTLSTTDATPLYVSDDAGQTWNPSPLSAHARAIRAIAIDPTTASSVSSTHIYAVGIFGPGNTRNGGIYKSLDGGLNWNVIDAGLPNSGLFIGTVRTAVLDARSCDNPPVSGPCISGPLKTIYVTANGFFGHAFEVSKSVDAGASWNDSSVGLPAVSNAAVYERVTPLPLVIDPSNSQVLYLGTFDSFDPSGVFGPPPPPSLSNGVFRSDDGGAHWYQQSSGLPRKEGSVNTALDVMALGIHPQDPNTLWAAVTDADFTVPVVASRIFKTTDGGAHWSDSSGGLQNCDVRVMKVDPVTPSVIYVGGFSLYGGGGCLYRSDDGGSLWVRQDNGLPADAVLAIDLDPQDHTRVVVGTNSGVYLWTNVPDAIFANGFEP